MHVTQAQLEPDQVEYNPMNLFEKIALTAVFMAMAPSYTGMISLESMLNGARDEASVRKALLETVMKYGKLVLYFGTQSCPPCRVTKAAIEALLSKYPDIMFVMIDLGKYPSLREDSWPKTEFFKNSTSLEKKSGRLDQAALKALLDKYYRP